MELNSPLSILGAFVVLALVLFGINALIGTTPPSLPVTGPSATTPEATTNSPYPAAPELQGIEGYINAPEGFTLASQKGKVVLVDFWTYSCINCIRTQPYLNAWYEKYHDQGLEIIGVHTPEFDFEKKYDNVKEAVAKAGITYPVVLDNTFQTWTAYDNHYWPHKYLVDAQGKIRYDHIGEGGYEETEKQIQALLKEKDDQLTLNGTVSGEIQNQTDSTQFNQIGTPEIYLGYDFARAPLASEEGFVPDATVTYTLPPADIPNQVGLEGMWTNLPDAMKLEGETGKVVLPYTAKQVNIVASGKSSLSVWVDGKELPTVEVDGEKLYTVVQGADYGSHVLTLDVSGKGFTLYTFTFG